MTLANQFGALLRMTLAGIPARLGLVSTIVIGVACAVGVLVSMLAMGVGARREALANARPDRAIVLSADAPSAQQSSLSRETAASIRELPGIRRNAEGNPIVVSQVTVFMRTRDRTNNLVGFPIAGV